MAKKAKQIESTGDDIGDLLLEAVGESTQQQEVMSWLDTGLPQLNEAISGSYRGGMPCGRIVEMFGPSSAGKTAIATNVMISAQRAGGIAMFCDHENSFDVGLAVNLGLSTASNKWVYKQPDTFEESVELIKKLGKIRESGKFPSDAPLVVVCDSLASMVPMSKLQDKDGEDRAADTMTMRDNLALAQCTSAHFPTISLLARKYNMLVLFLNQQRLKPGVAYGDNTTTPGGNAPEFYASVRIALTRAIIKDKASGEILGQQITATCRKNKVSRPFRTAKWRFMFKEDGSGFFDSVYSTLEFMKDKKIIASSGAYVIWIDGKNYHLGALAKKVEEEGGIPLLLDILDSKSTAEEGEDENALDTDCANDGESD